MVWSYQNADCSLKNKFTVSFIVFFLAHFCSVYWVVVFASQSIWSSPSTRWRQKSAGVDMERLLRHCRPMYCRRTQLERVFRLWSWRLFLGRLASQPASPSRRHMWWSRWVITDVCCCTNGNCSGLPAGVTPVAHPWVWWGATSPIRRS